MWHTGLFRFHPFARRLDRITGTVEDTAFPGTGHIVLTHADTLDPNLEFVVPGILVMMEPS